ncbi:flagellar biosynthetic protein FliO [Anaerobacillus sp. CMMVII]|uniref:flagellar biosynthetic protein FliO n=1 Tax=Anaerobacillus sp. CMMVII TaxID=2755588 RepID=UPI0021B82B79|nr:flagellar biosynthetic protein FliO [Anaerobacillus sp. CMMVII]MCT8139833.1 flagellar biosynthetic protein FliO [Anaerobacillus sp. CMMVII]
MFSRLQPMFYFRIILSMILFVGGSHSLVAWQVQANAPNNSVFDSYQPKDGQAPAENAENENTGQINKIDSDEVGGALEDQSLFKIFFQLFLALAVIILMIYALIRFIGKRTQSYQTHRTLQNIGGVHVGTNRSIQLVRVGKRVLVVGVGETIQLLKEIDDENEINTILEDFEVQEGQQNLSSFVTWAQTKLNGQGGNSPTKVNFKGLLERQLTEVKNSQKKAHAVIKEREQ